MDIFLFPMPLAPWFIPFPALKCFDLRVSEFESKNLPAVGLFMAPGAPSALRRPFRSARRPASIIRASMNWYARCKELIERREEKVAEPG
jgi:hypothetical protein